VLEKAVQSPAMVPGGLIAYAMRLAKYTRNEAARALRKALAYF